MCPSLFICIQFSITEINKNKKARSRQNRPLLTYEKHQVYYQFIIALLFLSITLITQNNSESRYCKIESIIFLM